MSQTENGRTALVTGATGAIGAAIARRIVAVPGYRVVLVGRDPARAAEAAAALGAETGGRVEHRVADLSLAADIEDLAAGWQGPLHVLVNVAAETPRHRLETPEGVERQFATNVLGYFRMIRAFTPALGAAAPTRVVNVASYWAGGLDLTDLEFRRRPYDNDSAYRQSKQADRMLAAAFARRLAADGISVNACHPGDVRSRLSTDLGFGGHQSADEAARTPAWLATGHEGGAVTGRYFERGREARCPYMADTEAVAALYAACEEYG